MGVPKTQTLRQRSHLPRPTGGTLDAGKIWRQEEEGMTEDKMVRWYHWLNGHEFDQALGVVDGQGSLAYCSPWGHKELDMTEGLNWKVALLVELQED